MKHMGRIEPKSLSVDILWTAQSSAWIIKCLVFLNIIHTFLGQIL